MKKRFIVSTILLSIIILLRVLLDSQNDTELKEHKNILLVLAFLIPFSLIITTLIYIKQTAEENKWKRLLGILFGIVISVSFMGFSYIDPIPEKLQEKKLEYRKIGISGGKFFFEIENKQFNLANYGGHSSKTLYKIVPKQGLGIFWFKKRYPHIIGFKIDIEKISIFADPNEWIRKHKIFCRCCFVIGILFAWMTYVSFVNEMKNK